MLEGKFPGSCIIPVVSNEKGGYGDPPAGQIVGFGVRISGFSNNSGKGFGGEKGLELEFLGSKTAAERGFWVKLDVCWNLWFWGRKSARKWNLSAKKCLK